MPGTRRCTQATSSSLSGVSVAGWFWGYVLPPVILLIGWAVYDAIDDRVEGHAGALYDKATGGAKATDAAGNVGTSTAITLTIRN